MIDVDIRRMIVRALKESNVYAIGDEALQESFVAGARDVALADLAIDSLAQMELCIAIESETGAVIVPGDLEKIGSLEGLVRAIGAA